MRPMSMGDRRARLRKRGRRLGIVVFAVLVASVTALWSVQIILQVWDPEVSDSATDCRAGVRDLVASLRRARDAAAQEPNGERAALARFRRALLPEWQALAAIDRRCRSDPQAAHALSRITALRYAEEHAVRYEAVALAEQRRRVDAIARELLGADSSL